MALLRATSRWLKLTFLVWVFLVGGLGFFRNGPKQGEWEWFGIPAAVAGFLVFIWMNPGVLAGFSGGGYSDDDDDGPPQINPGTGLPMMGPGTGGVDVGGNAWGSSDDD